jgi:isopenicillin N synthase-like dioxygenase
MKTTPEIPVIDVAPLLAGHADGSAKVVGEIGAACREVGFFYVRGHGVDPALRAGTFAQARAFFALPEARKATVSIAASPHNRGYVGLGGEKLDPTKPADMKQAYNIGLELAPDDPELAAGVPFRGLNLWPQLDGFRPVMLAYFDAVWRLGLKLHEAFARDLGLAPDYFADKLNRPMATLRLLHYPSMPNHVEAGQLGAGEHTDYGNITLLATDEAGGLEVRRRDGTWLAAPPIPDTFIINIGDCLMRWTNDVYVSTPHRVVNRMNRERMSIAFFLDPNPEAIVAALPGCVSSEAPAHYPPVRASDYLRSRLDPSYAHSVRKN